MSRIVRRAARDRRLTRVTSAASVAALLTTLLAACGSDSGPPSAAPQPPSATATTAPTVSPTPSPTPRPLPTLPRGGRTIFPGHRVIAYYGGSAGPGLGILGAGTPDQAADAIQKQADQYAFAGKPVLPAMELITTVALAEPGPDGTYASRGDPDAVARYLAAARRHKQLLILDFQPGRGDLLPEVKRYEQFIVQPDVGVALDPEWHMKPWQVPGQVIGSDSAADVNEVSAYLAQLVKARKLPQKLFVLHQFQPSMLPDREAIIARPGLATVFHADGNGSPFAKLDVYHRLAFPGPPFYRGFKLFLTRDSPTMTPQQAMTQVMPVPDLISYQ